jgi:hypothetical protein
MIDSRIIRDLRIALITMRVAEGNEKPSRSDMFVRALFPLTSTRIFYERFSPHIGELLAMADGFDKMRKVLAGSRDVASTDPVFLGLRNLLERISEQFDELTRVAG